MGRDHDCKCSAGRLGCVGPAAQEAPWISQEGGYSNHWGTFADLLPILYLFVSLGCNTGCAARGQRGTG